MDKLIEKHLNVTDMSFYPLEQAEKYANITKEIACGFAEWLFDYYRISGFYDPVNDKEKAWTKGNEGDESKYTTPELFDLYLKSL